ncbi:UDP-2,3-diacylglucosamine diphosphatase [Pseudomaricurvus alkylphenolicus]|uniref:UDP-2,3-diacylglucosamine diphosphatase n=1 Tax=Pseudomaricurvus alkylphenolicus TaxID=1306991 RepID=UPI0014232105|nr:UDP-2,3-diacylglucosamine diphosphatase [Pseudomaricurvus alkylphenolicus]NIB42018.1 UDP-2,3-diacylglucosamine diphosphatase [Pseudomaricurvus alkylphenolicus]
MKQHRTLWISDVHLGTKDCKAELLNDFLKHNKADTIYLVGDIIDGWKMQSGVYWKKEFTQVIRRLLKLSKQGVNINYITGNHDEFLRRFANNRLDNITLLNRSIHVTADNRRLLIIHGDQFDGVARCHQLLKFLGDKGNDLLMFLNRNLNHFRARYGYGYWSLAGYLKQHIRRARIYINDYEQGVARAAEKQGFDGVICGHIHKPAKKKIGKIDYYNTGDWVESCTALAEDSEGCISLIKWRRNLDEHSQADSADNDESELDDFETEGLEIPPAIAAKLPLAMVAATARIEEEVLSGNKAAPALIIPGPM